MELIITTTRRYSTRCAKTPRHKRVQQSCTSHKDAKITKKTKNNKL